MTTLDPKPIEAAVRAFLQALSAKRSRLVMHNAGAVLHDLGAFRADPSNTTAKALAQSLYSWIERHDHAVSPGVAALSPEAERAEYEAILSAAKSALRIARCARCTAAVAPAYCSADERCQHFAGWGDPLGGSCLAHDYEDTHADDERERSYESMGRRIVRPCASHAVEALS